MALRRDELGDLMAFLAVAEERSFTRAAARLGTSQSALSHVIRRLEERLDVRLLTRTTRNVATTEAGRQLAETLSPAFDAIEERLLSLDELRSRPSGTIRLTASRWAAEHIVQPVAERLMAEHPGVRVELDTDLRLVDIVREGFDAGIRMGEQVEKDMIAVRVGPDLRMAIAGTPRYFETHGTPRRPEDLTAHNCINIRLPTLGALYPWELEREGRALNVRVEGQFTSNDPDLVVKAALSGRGLACLPEDYFQPYLRDGSLQACLEDWCPPFPGYHLYYPSRRQSSAAFRLLVDALRYRE